MEPASIRYKNPGAMWGHVGKRTTAGAEDTTNNPHAVKWGSVTTFFLNDGLAQGNNIAVFPTYVQGICAQLDLWRSSSNYKNKPFSEAIAIWSGHNNVESYISYVLQRVPGMTRETIMNDAFWKSSMGIAFLKAQAGHEAGKLYPAPDGDWIEAQRRVMSGKSKAGAVVSTAVVAGTSVAVQQTGGHEMMKEFWIVAPLFFSLGYLTCQFHAALWEKISGLIWKK